MKLFKQLLVALALSLFAIAARAQSPFGNALNFNGGNYVAVTNFGNIIPTNEITVEFWADTAFAAGLSAFMLNPDQSTNRFNVHVNYGTAPAVGVTYWDFGNINGAGRLGNIAAPANSITNWVHYALVASQSGNYMAIYTNGVLCAAQSGMTPFVRGNYSLQVGYPYVGSLDEFRVWNIARSQAQIQAGMNTKLVGSETNLLLYYRFDNSSGNVATNSATATGAAYNGTLVNSPVWVSAGESFATGTVASVAYTFTTFAGSSAAGSSDGIGDGARFASPRGLVVDTNGNVYVADTINHTIRKITSSGVVTTLAGLAGSPGIADGTNNTARFNQPYGVVLDGSGNLYVADSMNDTIRKVTPSGTVITIAGLAGNVGSANGTNGAARFYNPFGIALDNSGNLYVADAYNFLIRKLTLVGTNWVVSTIAGKTGVNGSTDGIGTNALFNYPGDLKVDASGNVYVADSGNTRIRKITPAGVVTTIAGSVQPPLLRGYIIDGVGTNAQFYSLFGIALDNATNLYVADGNGNTVRKISPVGTNWGVTTIAGTYAVSGSINGTGTNAAFGTPWGIALDNSGNIYLADELNDNIRKITSAGVVTTLAGPQNSSSYLDGTGVNARFQNPSGVIVDNAGNIYVADSQNDVIRKITSAGVVSTLAGRGGVAAEQDGVGNQALFNYPYGIVADKFGNVYVTDNYSSAIRKVTPAGVVTTIAGSSGPGYQDGSAATAQFLNPAGIAIDQSGNLYVTEQDNLIRMIATNGIVSTIAGSPQRDINGLPINLFAYYHVGGYADGTGANARFNYPSGIAVDNAGCLYVADSDNYVIRKIFPPAPGGLSMTNPANWFVTTLVGTAMVASNNPVYLGTDGTGANASFGVYFYYQGPAGIALDGSGTLYVTDDIDNTIRKVTPAGVATTLAGQPGTVGSVDGSGNYAQFNVPAAIALDSSGGIYVADQLNNTIRKGTFTQYGSANIASVVLPAMAGQLQVSLSPLQANGQWRFPWEVAWRNSGQTASNLVAGNYPVQFRSVPGWLAIPSSLTVAVTNGGTTFLTNQYFPTISTVDTNSGGTLTVTLGPSPPGGAGWRFLGDTTPFYPSGYSTNLIAGTYLIEFAAVSGRVKPPNSSVQVQPGLPTLLAENYLLAQSAPGQVLLPFPVPNSNISDLVDYPFGFNGQLQSDVGYGSGVAVEANVVLTAAHIVFNDETLSYVSQAYWYFQREAGIFEPEPLAARGWYMLSGYASQRTNDLEVYAPNTSTPQSRNLDVAALYFLSPVAGGGYSGYLPSDQTPNPWLTGNSLKMLVGYPVDGSEFGNASITTNAGTMYQTQPQPYPLSLATDPVAGQQVYAANWFLSYPGNSGGPLYVQYNGYYYPAAIYSGTLYNGVTPYASAVRAIDSQVVNLITNAEYLGDAGINHPGGGVVIIIPSQAVSASNPGYLEFQLGPPAAVAAGAGWQLQGDSTYSNATNYIRAVFSTNAFTVVFKPIAGWNVPTNQSVTVLPGQITSYSALYTVSNPLQIVSPQVSGGAFQLSFQSVNGQSYTLYYNNNLTTTNWLPYTNVTGNGGTLQLTIPITNSAQRFFRISQP